MPATRTASRAAATRAATRAAATFLGAAALLALPVTAATADAHGMGLPRPVQPSGPIGQTGPLGHSGLLGPVGHARPSTHLTVSYDDGSGRPSSYTLTCGNGRLFSLDSPGSPDNADNADSADSRDDRDSRDANACRRLDEIGGPVTSVPEGQACSMIYGGPQTAELSGTWRGRPVTESYRRTNGCEVARWSRMVPALPNPTATETHGPITG